MEAVKLRQGVLTAMKIAEAGNGLIQAHRLDNSLIASEPDLAAAVVGTVINLILLCSAVFEPYLPSTCASIRKQLNSDFLQIPSEEDIASGWKPTYLKPGHKIGKAEYLFTKIDEKKADEWREHFGGNQAERAKKAEEEAKKAAKKAAEKEKAKAKKAAKKQAAAGGVEASAKGGEDKTLANGEPGDAVDKVVDGVAQVTIPTS
jgi:methionyl-tRNA synthetase